MTREIGLDPLSLLGFIAMPDLHDQPPTVAATMMFVRAALATKLDKSGLPLSDHCIRVMKNMGQDATETEKLVALLHDIIEDTDHTKESLLALGYSAEIVEAVDILSNPNPEGDYFDYLRGIVASGNALARRVKMADNLDNGDPSRIVTLPVALRERFAERYRRAWRILTEQEK